MGLPTSECGGHGGGIGTWGAGTLRSLTRLPSLPRSDFLILPGYIDFTADQVVSGRGRGAGRGPGWAGGCAGAAAHPPPLPASPPGPDLGADQENHPEDPAGLLAYGHSHRGQHGHRHGGECRHAGGSPVRPPGWRGRNRCLRHPRGCPGVPAAPRGKAGPGSSITVDPAAAPAAAPGRVCSDS